MEQIIGFGMKDCLSLPSIGWNPWIQNELKTSQNSKTIECMRQFVRQYIKRDELGAFNQYYGS